MADTSQRARNLAKTGRFANWSFIAAQLRQEGVEDASKALASIDLRRELDRVCREARRVTPS